MILVDTNVLLDAANYHSDFHEVCRKRLEAFRQSASPWFLSWPICYEFLRVVTHPAIPTSRWSLAAAWQFLETLLDCASADILLATPRHGTILAELLNEVPQLRGNIIHDLHTAVLMREHGIRQICTRDTDFHRFPHVTVIDPAK